jgi:hypothetical protein
MRLVSASALAIALASMVAASPGASSQTSQDPDRVVAGGGISVPGWTGKVDPKAASQGRSIKDSKFVREGEALHLTIGPAAIYWNPKNTASGDYTVKATFKEAKVTADHPHPYGVFIGGSRLDTDQQSLMYCIAYGDGTFLVRQFNGTNVTTVAKRQPHAAIHKAGADGSVANEVGWRVSGGRAECLINGTAVAGFDKSEIVGPGKLESTDGIYGLRVSHNLDVVVSGFGAGKD